MSQLFLSSIDSLTNCNNIWFLDCACTNHMAHDRRLFQSIEISNINEVSMGHEKTAKIEGIGTIEIQTRTGQDKVLKNVYYIPKLTHNLLSLGQLMEWGYKFNFDGKKCIIRHKKRNMPPIFVLMVGRRMFPVIILDLFEFSMMSNRIDESMIWHQRYAHFHFNVMMLLYMKNMVEVLPSISYENQVCEGCIFGKEHSVPFPLGPTWRA